MALGRIDPATLDLEKGRELIGLDYWDGADLNRKFFEGDHWNDGKGWKGPQLDPRDASYEVTKEMLELGFVSRNVVKETCGRKVDGLLGKEPEWGFSVR